MMSQMWLIFIWLKSISYEANKNSCGQSIRMLLYISVMFFLTEVDFSPKQCCPFRLPFKFQTPWYQSLIWSSDHKCPAKIEFILVDVFTAGGKSRFFMRQVWQKNGKSSWQESWRSSATTSIIGATCFHETICDAKGLVMILIGYTPLLTTYCY